MPIIIGFSVNGKMHNVNAWECVRVHVCETYRVMEREM